MDKSSLIDMNFPKFSFHSTDGVVVPASNRSEWMVIYIYPMIPGPELALPEGWLSMPGATGCTRQSCSFRDYYAELKKLNVELFGLSSQPVDQQRKAKERLNLPFELISDEALILKKQLGLPTFYVENTEYYERHTLVLQNGIIKNVFYPIRFPQTHVHDVLDWLENTKVDIIEGNT